MLFSKTHLFVSTRLQLSLGKDRVFVCNLASRPPCVQPQQSVSFALQFLSRLHLNLVPSVYSTINEQNGVVKPFAKTGILALFGGLDLGHRAGFVLALMLSPALN